MKHARGPHSSYSPTVKGMLSSNIVVRQSTNGTPATMPCTALLVGLDKQHGNAELTDAMASMRNFHQHGLLQTVQTDSTAHITSSSTSSNCRQALHSTRTGLSLASGGGRAYRE